MVHFNIIDILGSNKTLFSIRMSPLLPDSKTLLSHYFSFQHNAYLFLNLGISFHESSPAFLIFEVFFPPRGTFVNIWRHFLIIKLVSQIIWSKMSIVSRLKNLAGKFSAACSKTSPQNHLEPGV